MKRDLELIREILLAVEAANDPRGSPMPEIDGTEPYVIAHHIGLLEEAGYVTAQNASTQDRRNFHWIHLTWQGHEFLDALRDETVWKKVKAKVTSAGGSLSFELVKAIGIAAVREALKI